MAEDKSTDALNEALLNAHAVNDFSKIIELYFKAAQKALSTDIDSACFLFTQAYVYSLENGHPKAEEIRDILVLHGREVSTPIN